MQILVIDNNPERQKSIKQCANNRGHEIKNCVDLAAAIEEFTTHQHDAVFIADTEGGWDGCGLIRNAPGGSQCQIIALATHDEAEKALSQGADDYLLTPTTEEALGLKLFVSEQRLRRISLTGERNISNAQSIWDTIQTQDQIGVAILNSKGAITLHNPYAQALLSNQNNDISNQILFDFLNAESNQINNYFQPFLSRQTSSFRTESLCLGSVPSRWLKITAERIAEPANDDAFAVVIIEDISVRMELEETLKRHNLYDPLTELPNRSLLVDRLSHAMKGNRREPQRLFALLFVDIDRFKVLNDTVGRENGDKLLIDLARRLERSIRPGDTVAHLGGDEFGILLENIKSVSGATRVSERIREELIEPAIIDGKEILLSVSIGISTSESDYASPEEVIRDADTAMHRAKTLGKGRHHIFDREMHERIKSLLSLEQDLRRALEKEEFWVAYQPIIDLKSGKIYGVEALLRWNHGERGFISPADFIPIAEECGVILSLGEWVLKESCKQAQDWHSQFQTNPRLHLSVNVSSKQFADPSLVEKVEGLLAESQLDPRSLSLEITESVVMEKSESSTDALANLQRLGIRLHMDDFGTGYSSLAYLHRFPMDALKIDRSFIMRMDQGDRTIELVRTIINLARTQKLNVVAEGVETQKHLDTLRALGCDYAQGYFFSKPLDSKGISELLASSPSW